MTDLDELKKRKRIFINSETGARDIIEIIKRAAEDKYDAIVFPFHKKFNANSKYVKLAKKYEIAVEAGGRDLSLLVPRKLFFSHHELFRMEQGKRKHDCHFCPTNPETMAVIIKQAQILFAYILPAVTEPCVFHLLPEKGMENTWCACPACRAFTPAEQNLITVNTAADVLAKLAPNARLAFFDYGITQEEERDHAGIAPRGNMFAITNQPFSSLLSVPLV